MLKYFLEKIKRDFCKAPVFGMPTEKGMFVLDTDASVVAVSHQWLHTPSGTKMEWEDCSPSKF